MSEADLQQKWEEAYFRQQAVAAVGRMFGGLVHNLNGIVQAFSMQSELFAITFPQLEKLLGEGAAAPEHDFQQRMERIRAILESRAKLSEQMRQKVQAAQDILHRTQLLSMLIEGNPFYSVATLLRTEIDFLQADMFFKHQVAKELKLEENLPAVRQRGLELHQSVFVLLANAADALREGIAQPRILLEARNEGTLLRLGVEDNGPGIAPADRSRIFEPFFTTKNGHDGLGLYLVEKIMTGCGGQIHCASRPGLTRFELVVPKENI